MFANSFRYYILLLFISFMFKAPAFSQCRDFTEQKLIPQLGDFLLNGRYHSFLLQEGDEIMILKSLSTGIEYKFVFGVADQLPQNTIIVIKDWQNHIIFDNRVKNFSKVFVIQPQKAMRIKIYIKVPQINDPPKKGCVGLVIGMKKI